MTVIQIRPDGAVPQDTEAELWLLQGLLQAPAHVADCADIVRADDFHDEGYATLFRALVENDARGTPVTVADLINLMGAHEKAEEWRLAITAMRAASFVATDFRSLAGYAKKVADSSLRRGLIRVSRDLGQQAVAGEDAGAVLRTTEAALADLEQRGGGDKGLRDMGAVMRSTLHHLEAVMRGDAAIAGKPTGVGDLDKALGGARNGNLIVYAARPGMGKTALAINAAEATARAGGFVAFYSHEMSREQIGQRIIAARTGIPIDKQQSGPLTNEDWRRICAVGAEIAELPMEIDDGRHKTVASMVASARRLQRRRGLALIVVDYIQLLVGGDSRNRVEEVSRITRDLKLAAKDLDVPIIALSQLSRQVESRDDKRPLKSDLRDSGSIEQDADQIVFIYRPDYYLREPERKEGEDGVKFMARQTAFEQQAKEIRGLAELIVAKNRHGRECTVRSHWDGQRQRFSDMGWQR
ncbi:replicative DNA helicase [Inquilinus sp.]|jgi:replicative DNA helicase|uniref:replicative DNA helicase n=1 Tax=Inquilinus sp. TaxID=1932117 RepID=UPI00378359A9